VIISYSMANWIWKFIHKPRSFDKNKRNISTKSFWKNTLIMRMEIMTINKSKKDKYFYSLN